MSALRIAIATLALAGPVAAQELDQLGRQFELAAHAALMHQVEQATAPAPFTTDGCSGGLSASWQSVAAYWPQFAAEYKQHPPFDSCCITHDRAYHNAGSAHSVTASYTARLTADQALQACVISTGKARQSELAAKYKVSEAQVDTAYQLLASSLYYSVRFGGGPCSGLSWRWGYGYQQCWIGKNLTWDNYFLSPGNSD